MRPVSDAAVGPSVSLAYTPGMSLSRDPEDDRAGRTYVLVVVCEVVVIAALWIFQRAFA